MPSTINQNKTGSLYLIPNIIHPDTENQVIAPVILTTIKQVDYFLVENARNARRYLSNLMKLLPENQRKEISNLKFELLDKNTSAQDVTGLLQPIKSGKNCGIISDSGCPGIADPGSEAVMAAHQMNIKVIPLPGPSSIFLALMASGMNGQSFAFHGYLPIDRGKLVSKIKQLENDAKRFNQTQIFMETPYRNQRIFDALISTCKLSVSLCVAQEITGPQADIKTMTIGEWKSKKVSFRKVPAVFLLWN